jgi:hypothetical protein
MQFKFLEQVDNEGRIAGWYINGGPSVSSMLFNSVLLRGMQTGPK